jgi:2,3-dihydroxy-2,3-dihydrophenylpropionate dehydrogenase
VIQPTRPRRILVTGGASGIGLAVVRAFMAEGDFVVSLDLAESSAASESVIGDVRDSQSHEQAVAVASGGAGLDVLVVNAGIHDGGLGLHSDVDELSSGLRAVLEVDVVGYVLALRAAAADLKAASGVALLTLSDASFLSGQTGAGIAYTAAKHAQVGILMWAARDLAPDIRVNGVAPGGVITGLRAVDKDGGRPLFADAQAKRDLVASRNPLGTVLEPDEVAQIFVWLASSAARGMTGQIIRPDGGLVVR